MTTASAPITVAPLAPPGLVDSDGGPAVAVAWSDGQVPRGGGRHAHVRAQLIGAVSGLLAIDTDAGRWVVPPVHAVWIPPRVFHSLASHGPFAGWSIYVAPEAAAALSDRPEVIRPSDLLLTAVRRAADWAPGGGGARGERLAAVILDELAIAPVEDFRLPLPDDARLVRVARAILADPADRRGLAYWAGVGALSVRTLSRRFPAETGFSVTAWRQRARLLGALEGLADGRPVTAVALDAGYDNVSAFIARFRAAFGTTPGRWQAESSAPSRHRDRG